MQASSALNATAAALATSASSAAAAAASSFATSAVPSLATTLPSPSGTPFDPLVLGTSLLGGLGGMTGLGAAAGPLGWLAGFLPVLLGFSSALRGFVGTPFKWLLDAFCTTAYVDASAPPAAWLALYLAELPDRLLVSRELEVEVLPDAVDDENDAPAVNYWGEPTPALVGSAAVKLHSFRLIPLPSSHTVLRHKDHLLVVSREVRTSHSLTKTRYGGARSGRGGMGGRNNRFGGAENGSDSTQEEQIKYLKIRFIPVPRWPSFRLLFFSRHTSPPASSQQVLDDLVAEAKAHFAERDQRGVTAYRYEYQPESGMRTWSGKATRGKRSIASVVLPDGVGQDILDDVKGFLERRDWYMERGIPHRRGVLLFGEAGAGKTSLVTAVASELLLNIYVLDLSDDDMGDSELLIAINQTPPNCIVLMEDIDCAFAPRLSFGTDPNNAAGRISTVQTLTLSGLLNAVDGVGASEGRICFATTNHISRLDPALIRPGRMDRHVKFSLATKKQAAGLFRQMLLPTAGELAKRRALEPADKEGEGGGEKWEAREEAQRRDVLRLADAFAEHVPDDTFSTASLQGYLLRHKDQPQAAVDGIAEWVVVQKQANEDQRRSADSDWELRLRLKAREERRMAREKEKLRKEAQKGEVGSSSSEGSSSKAKKEKQEVKEEKE